MAGLLVAGCHDPVRPEIARDLGGEPAAIIDPVLPTDPQRLATGNAFGCALRPDGTAGCWGLDDLDQAPASRTAASGIYTQITAGYGYACALRTDGVVECWGDPSWNSAPATVTAAAGQFTQVAAGGFHACALRDDGVVECWGNDDFGQAPTTRAATSGVFTRVSAGYYHTCAIRTGGTAECWGLDISGQAPATRPPLNSSFVQISAGGEHTCALRADAVIECWGHNVHGQAAGPKADPRQFVQISAGAYHTCGTLGDGNSKCWGRNDDGEAPGTRPVNGSVAQISAGGRHSCAMLRDGIVRCWGDPSSGATTLAAAPVPPDNVNAFANVVVQAKVTWSYASGGTTWARVARKIRTGATWTAWEGMADTQIDGVFFVDGTVDDGEEYGYRVRSCTLGGCSAWSPVKTTVIKPAPPVSLTATASSSTSVTLAWPDHPSENGYEIERRSQTGGIWSAWAFESSRPTNATDYVDGAATADRHQYRIRACRLTCSDWRYSEKIAP